MCFFELCIPWNAFPQKKESFNYESLQVVHFQKYVSTKMTEVNLWWKCSCICTQCALSTWSFNYESLQVEHFLKKRFHTKNKGLCMPGVFNNMLLRVLHSLKYVSPKMTEVTFYNANVLGYNYICTQRTLSTWSLKLYPKICFHINAISVFKSESVDWRNLATPFLVGSFSSGTSNSSLT